MEIMNAGMGETSYAKNSKVQLKVISMTMPIIEEAITNLYYNSTSPSSLVIADFGCSSGPNTLFAVSELIKVVEKLRRQQGQQSPEYQVFLNDLPENDFNVIFKLLPSFQKKFSSQLGVDAGSFFFSGVPGSFYGRLFPKKSLHFTFSSYSLHWLSQVPEHLENNKRSIYISSTSPPNVAKAYYAQFQKDFSMFLKSRAEELAVGGRMVLTFLGRKSEDPSTKECGYIWEVLAIALCDMVDKGLIGEEKLDSFNLPHYAPSASELKSVVLMENYFSIDRLEVSELKWSSMFGERNFSEAVADLAMCVRAVVEPFLVSHFGDAIIDLGGFPQVQRNSCWKRLQREQQHHECDYFSDKKRIIVIWMFTYGLSGPNKE
ncbi:hypothetical protein I3760_07G047000 [Carya illinoinensis]|nr:hypothetical protein I3760_07G047000 [Carya illinoinensis]